MKKVFDTHGSDSELNCRSGSLVEVVRSLTFEEADLSETGPMYRIRFADGAETDAFADELTEEKVDRKICECVFDISLMASYLIGKENLDVKDSRELFDQIYGWAFEFESSYSEESDYMLDIEEFAAVKLRERYGGLNE